MKINVTGVLVVMTMLLVFCAAFTSLTRLENSIHDDKTTKTSKELRDF